MADSEETAGEITTEGKPLKEYVESFEKMLIDNTMRRHKGSIAAVMDALGRDDGETLHLLEDLMVREMPRFVSTRGEVFDFLLHSAEIVLSDASA